MSDAAAVVVGIGASAALPLAVRSALAAGHRARARRRAVADACAARTVGVDPPALPPPLAPLASLATAARLRLDTWGGRGRRRRGEAVALVLATAAQHLRAGRSLAQAVGASVGDAPAALAGDLVAVRDRARAEGLAGALRWWTAERADEPLVRAAAAAIGVAVTTGGPALPAVEVAEDMVRARQALAGEVRALTAQARASAAVIGVAPLAMALLSAVADPAAGRFLLTTAPGLALLLAGLTLDAMGVAWMAALLRRFQS